MSQGSTLVYPIIFTTHPASPFAPLPQPAAVGKVYNVAWQLHPPPPQQEIGPY